MIKKTKEAIKTTAVIILVIAAVLALWIYPLNQSGKIVTRPETPITPYNLEEYGLTGDTLALVTEDNINLAGRFIDACVADSESAAGTVILLHGLFDDGPSQMAKAVNLITDGFNIIIYDQRAFGASDGEYRSGGYFEANDLQSVIARLDLEDRLARPIIVWGEDHGATAALRIWQEETRIDYIIAESPVVTGRDWQKRVVDHDELSAPGFYLSLVWWWMKQKSGYEISVDETDISDQYGWALLNREGRLLIIACGSEDEPANDYLAELKAMGGDWLVVDCADTSLYESNQEGVYSSIKKLLIGYKPPAEE